MRTPNRPTIQCSANTVV